MDETSRIIRPILLYLFPTAPEATVELYHAVIRKCAHFVEYGILGALAIRAFYDSRITVVNRHKFAAAAIVVILVASSDEFHQSFEPKRTASVYDIALDWLGGLTAIAMIWIAHRLLRNRG